MSSRFFSNSESLPRLVENSESWNLIVIHISAGLKEGTLSFEELERFSKLAFEIQCHFEKDFSHCQVHISYLKRDIFGWIVQSVIQSVLKNPEDANFFEQSCRILQNFLYCQPIETLTQSILQQCIAIATLPWMSGEVNLADVRVGDTLSHNLISVSHKVEASLSSRQKAIAIKTIATLPKELSPRWRVTSFKKAWGNATDSDKCQLLGLLPLWLYCIGSAGKALAAQIVVEAVATNEKAILTQVAKNAGTLVCVQSRLCTSRKKGGQVEVICPRCDIAVFGKKESSTVPMLSYQDVESLLKLVGHPDSDVKIPIISIIQPLSNHVGFTESLCALWLNYIEAATYDQASFRFSSKVRYITGPGYLLDDLEADLESGNHENVVGWSQQERVCNTLIGCLRDAAKRATYDKKNQSPFHLDCLCRMLVSVGETGVSFAEKAIVEIFFGLLVDFRISTYTHAEAFIKPRLMKYKKEIMKMLAEKLCSMNDDNARVAYIHSVMVIFESRDSSVFLKQHIHCLIPHLVVLSANSALQNQRLPIDFVAEQMNQETRYLLAGNFQFIFPYLAMQTTVEDYQKCVQYLKNETNLPLEQLIPGNRQKMTTELILGFHKYNKRVQTALQWLAKNDIQFKCKRKSMGKSLTKEDLVSVLSRRFM